MYFCLYLFLLYIEPSRWFCMQFPYPSVSHRGFCILFQHIVSQFQVGPSVGVSRRSEAEISPVSPLHSLNPKVWRSSTQRDVSETDWAQRFDKGFQKQGVSWVNLSLLIYYWWIEVASDGFLAWCDMMPRAFCTLGGQDDTSETRTGSRSRVLSSTRSGFLLGHPFTGELSMRSQKAGFSHVVFLLPCFIFLLGSRVGKGAKNSSGNHRMKLPLELKRPLMFPTYKHVEQRMQCVSYFCDLPPCTCTGW